MVALIKRLEANATLMRARDRSIPDQFIRGLRKAYRLEAAGNITGARVDVDELRERGRARFCSLEEQPERRAGLADP